VRGECQYLKLEIISELETNLLNLLNSSRGITNASVRMFHKFMWPEALGSPQMRNM
jgi:hypothetical protein